jgi:hypothetical protein
MVSVNIKLYVRVLLLYDIIDQANPFERKDCHGERDDHQSHVPLSTQRLHSRHKYITILADYTCPPIILPQLESSGPNPIAPSPLHHATTSCGASVHLTLAKRGFTWLLLVEARRPNLSR